MVGPACRAGPVLSSIRSPLGKRDLLPLANMNHAYAELIRRVKECRLLNSCAELLAWDERTYMPHNGSAHRAEQMALLARMAHEMTTAPEIGELLAALESSELVKEGDSVPAANLREIRRSYDRAVKLPKELVEE